MSHFISQHNILPQKRFGQNFLTDKNIIFKIIETAAVTKEDTVLEIGSGTGALTRKLCQLARQVIAVEIDKKLADILNEDLCVFDNFKLITGDFLKLPADTILGERENRSVKVVANLPYYITTPILMRILENGSYFKSITIMLQKEVAQRLTASPGTKEYGAITLAVNYYALPEIAFDVSPNCFFPKPNVDSVVMQLTPYRVPPVCVKDQSFMFQLIRAAFDQRRKTLCNAVANFGGFNISKSDVESALEEMELPHTIRGERLSLKDFAILSDKLDSDACPAGKRQAAVFYG